MDILKERFSYLAQEDLRVVKDALDAINGIFKADPKNVQSQFVRDFLKTTKTDSFGVNSAWRKVLQHFLGNEKTRLKITKSLGLDPHASEKQIYLKARSNPEKAKKEPSKKPTAVMPVAQKASSTPTGGSSKGRSAMLATVVPGDFFDVVLASMEAGKDLDYASTVSILEKEDYTKFPEGSINKVVSLIKKRQPNLKTQAICVVILVRLGPAKLPIKTKKDILRSVITLACKIDELKSVAGGTTNIVRLCLNLLNGIMIGENEICEGFVKAKGVKLITDAYACVDEYKLMSACFKVLNQVICTKSTADGIGTSAISSIKFIVENLMTKDAVSIQKGCCNVLNAFGRSHPELIPAVADEALLSRITSVMDSYANVKLNIAGIKAVASLFTCPTTYGKLKGYIKKLPNVDTSDRMYSGVKTCLDTLKCKRNTKVERRCNSRDAPVPQKGYQCKTCDGNNSEKRYCEMCYNRDHATHNTVEVFDMFTCATKGSGQSNTKSSCPLLILRPSPPPPPPPPQQQPSSNDDKQPTIKKEVKKESSEEPPKKKQKISSEEHFDESLKSVGYNLDIFSEAAKKIGIPSFEEALKRAEAKNYKKKVKTFIKKAGCVNDPAFSKLSIDEKAAIIGYTAEIQSNDGGNVYKQLNEAFGSRNPKDTPNNLGLMCLFLSGLRKMPDYHKKGILYRGMSLEQSKIDKDKKAFDEGKERTWYSPVSTTTDLKAAKRFAKAEGELQPVIYEIHNGFGCKVEKMSLNKNEHEVILEPDRKYKVIGIEPFEDMIKIKVKITNPKFRALEFIK